MILVPHKYAFKAARRHFREAVKGRLFDSCAHSRISSRYRTRFWRSSRHHRCVVLSGAFRWTSDVIIQTEQKFSITRKTKPNKVLCVKNKTKQTPKVDVAWPTIVGSQHAQQSALLLRVDHALGLRFGGSEVSMRRLVTRKLLAEIGRFL